ncbi:hypothetical protein VK792_06275 [Mesobacterium sp. TK19101]|uniref:Uncharacterized protein n=1 Tax=Mesobacterium hydrothermale TaxID=3111907 RepID=A0ABU6HEI8_9RHOB|nr:hypothetical protein [Mesobacterium sp. TK19101]MEC3860883.1 hypothetical protein [Mesobacterium sp. TK19101]
MRHALIGLMLCALGACSTPVTPPASPPVEAVELPAASLPGTGNPSPYGAIVRREAQNDETGAGHVTNIAYQNDFGQDEFRVENIAFGGTTTYTRGDPVTGVAQLGRFGVYEGTERLVDPVTGDTLQTFDYRLVAARGANGATEVAIVRSGSTVDQGFGGFIFQRNAFDDNGDETYFVMPMEGDAYFAGDYAGIRVFEGHDGLEYVVGRAVLLVDFEDAYEGGFGPILQVTNRRAYDVNGTEVTASIVQALEGQYGALPGLRDANGTATLPEVLAAVGPETFDRNGEFNGPANVWVLTPEGRWTALSQGTMHGVMTNEEPGFEAVGVVVLSGDDPRLSGTRVVETGGFVVVRE